MVRCYIGIGSNLGERETYVAEAVRRIKAHPGMAFRRSSSVYETAPVSTVPQGAYLNSVIEIDTALSPRGLLAELQKIETDLGRVRTVKDGPRTIDLDILYYDDETVADRDLVIPHPRMQEREFVLKGLRELGRA